MKNICIFCKDGIPNTKEHIIPKWLIKFTNMTNQSAIFGPYNEKSYFIFKELPFTSFVFPACNDCNNTFSIIESKTKRIFKKILRRSPLNSSELNILLSWFDKLRIGLRVGLFLMKKQKERLKDFFFINSNIQAKDRMLLIYKNKEFVEDLVVICANTPAFQFLPSCFAIKINNFGFINISEHFLLSNRMGLPYPRKMYLIKQEFPQAILLVQGTKKINYPIIEEPYDKDCTEIYQIILSNSERKFYPSLYGDPFSNSFFINESSGLGHILYHKDGDIIKYQNENNFDWYPVEKNLGDREFIKLLIMQTLKFQNFLNSNYSLKIYNNELKSREKRRRANALKWNARALTQVKYKF